jgi:cation:H+ antiporter
MTIWLQFFGCTALIVFSGTQLSRYGDIIAEMTGMGRTWVGLVLIASVTSLPELITGISSVAIFDLPDIAAGDVLGSCMFNILIIALLDLTGDPLPISTRGHHGQVIAAGFGIVLLSLTATAFVLDARIPAIFWISPFSLIFIAVYFLAIRISFLYEKRRISEFIKEHAEEVRYKEITKIRAYTMYALNALLVVAAATYLPSIGGQIAEKTGLGGTFVGSIFIALSTSLPELVVSISALRIGAVDMVLGNLFGSNLFNITILAVDDILYTKGPLIGSVAQSHMITANAAMIMTAIAVIGLIYKTSKKLYFLAWDSLGILLVYVLAISLLYASR